MHVIAAQPASSSRTKRTSRRGPIESCSCATVGWSIRRAPHPGPSRCCRAEPIVAGEPGRAGRRAVIRWAARLFRRDWRQQVLVLALLTIAVGASVTLAASVVNTANDRDGRFGDASVILRFEEPDAAAANQRLTALREQFGTID